MTAAAVPRLTAGRPGPRRFLGLVCILLFAASAWAIVEESSRRRAIVDAAGRDLAALPPAILDTAGIVEDSDGAALIVAEGLLDARNETAATVGLDPAREIVLETAVRRPGSAHARLLLGRAAATDASADHWKKPLELASKAAPGLEPAAAALGRSYLAAWPRLGPEERREAEAALSRAFQDPSFLRASFRVALQRLGPDTAVRLVPDDPAALEAAYRAANAAGARRALDLLSERRKPEGPGAGSRPTP